MEHVTLSLALLLGAGLLAAKIGQRFRLPSVTGYILAGLLLGPSATGFISHEMVASGRLEHFTALALMLIAFGIGEHLELRRLRQTFRGLLLICAGETVACFLLVTGGVVVLARLSGLPSLAGDDVLLFGLLLGSVAIATAPASTLHVVREIRAAGPLSTVLLQEVAMNNAMAIICFGVSMTVAHHLAGQEGGSLLMGIGRGLGEISLSLLLGVLAGLLIDVVVHNLKNKGEMLTFGLAVLLLCGEGARLLGLSPLLAGMAVGFVIVNRDRRDVRLFRMINAFEPPIYVLFFTLAGAELERDILLPAGWLGLAYFLLRAMGKLAGAGLGARLGRMPVAVRDYLGISLLPQADVAIGLVFLLKGSERLEGVASLLIPVILAGVLLAETVGPVATRWALFRAEETEEAMAPAENGKPGGEMAITPWTWPPLQPPADQAGSVVFGAASAATVTGLARMAVLLAHHHRARPLAVRVVRPDCTTESCIDSRQLFVHEAEESARLGYQLSTVVVHTDDVPDALLATARQADARAIILGHPPGGTSPDMLRVVEKVARQAPCQVVVIRFCGRLHTERILVPVVRSVELEVVSDMVKALAEVGRHRITLLRLVPSDLGEDAVAEVERRLAEWAQLHALGPFVFSRVVATDTRLDLICEEAPHHDLVVMAASQAQGVQRLFFGSLAADVALRCPRTMVMVHGPSRRYRNGC
ncbi:MAG: cation:proton antiporter [Thermodesulfobacteriota bacterium]